MPQKRITKKINDFVMDYLALLEKDSFPIHQAFVFGSRIYGKPHAFSDIDVAIISPKLKDPLTSIKYLLRKAHQLENDQFYIEPHGFHPKEFTDENPLVWEIKTKGAKIR